MRFDNECLKATTFDRKFISLQYINFKLKNKQNSDCFFKLKFFSWKIIKILKNISSNITIFK